jgi:hypothetical protein
MKLIFDDNKLTIINEWGDLPWEIEEIKKGEDDC